MPALPVPCAVVALAALAAAQAARPWSVPVPTGATPDAIARLAGTVRPHPRQHAWLALEFTAFVHFGMNTFTDREWGDGREDPASFAPTDFDARQWTRAFRDAGMRGVVLTAKHHDGFCLWPSATTAHSVARAPWRDGRGDVVAEVAAACRADGLAFGIYLSPWDRNAPSFGTKAYDDLFHAQLRELLSNYGALHDVWFDGAHAPKDDPSTFDWTRHYRAVRELQPDACISVMGPDVRWCGNEAGHTRAAEWNVIPLDCVTDADPVASYASLGSLFAVPVQARDLGSRAALAAAKRLMWWPAMTNTSIRPGWFHHPAEDHRVRPLADLLDVYYGAVGGGTQFLLNVPPDRRGRLHDHDVARLAQIGAVLRATFGTDLVAGAARVATDAGIEWRLPSAVTFDVVRVAEDVLEVGQRVEAFRCEAFVDGAFRPIDGGDGATIGPNRLLRTAATTTDRIRLVVTASRGAPAIARLGLHRRPAVLRAPTIRRAADGIVTIDAAPGTRARVALGDGPFPADAPLYTAPLALPDGGTVRARAEPLDPAAALDLGLGAEATARFGLRRDAIRVVGADSEQAPEEAAAKVLDGDPATLWHSRWSPDSPGHPHWIALDLGAPRRVTGLVYVPRTDNGNGTITRASLQGSADGLTWSELLPPTELANVANLPVPQTLALPAAASVRFLRLTSHAAVDDRPWASAAELEVLVR